MYKCDYCRDEMPEKFKISHDAVCEMTRNLWAPKLDAFLESLAR